MGIRTTQRPGNDIFAQNEEDIHHGHRIGLPT